MNAYQGMTDLFEIEGVTTIFSYMAEDNLHLLAHLHERRSDGFRVIHARHEQGAVAMADGYSRATGEIGVCTVGRGPAVAQAAAPLVTAQKHGSKLLAIVPESPTDWPYTQDHIKRFDQEPFLRSLADSVISVRSPAALMPNLKEAFRLIRAGGGPVIVQIAKDVFTAELPLDASVPASPTAVADPAPVTPSETAVAAAADELSAADRPVVLVGRGAALESEPRRAIADLADRLGAVIATTLPALGAFEGNPRSLGMVGGFGSTAANEYVRGSDCLIAFGTSLSKFTTETGELLAPVETVIHVDDDRQVPGRYVPVTLAIHGDAGTTARAIDEALAAVGIEDKDGPPEAADDSPGDGLGPPGRTAPDRIDPRTLIAELDTLLPSDRLVVTDVGHYLPWVYQGITISSPGDLVLPLDFGVVGQALPQGIGVSAGSPERTTVVFCGDGGLMMTLPELETAVRHEIPVLVFVMNDGALGAEYHHLEKLGLSTEPAVLPTPMFSAVAEALGAEGHTVRSIGDLQALEDHVREPPSNPVVVDCRIDREVRHRWMDPD